MLCATATIRRAITEMGTSASKICWPKNQKPPVSFPLFRCEACLRQRAMIRHKPPYAIRYSMRLPHFLESNEADNFGCTWTWTLCSTKSGDGWPQRSQLQPGVPSLGRCVSLLPAMFCNLGLGDPLSSCNKRIVFISYSFFAWRTYGRRDRKDFTRIGFLLCETCLDRNQPRRI
jgi:hypothetical protein